MRVFVAAFNAMVFLAVCADAMEQGNSMMRKHKAEKEVALTGSGEMLELKDVQRHEPVTAKEREMIGINGEAVGKDDTLGRDLDMCNDDFPVGKENTNNCSEANAEYSQILQEAMCVQAAKDANATADPHKFRITREWFDTRPKGCFRAKCSEDPKGICYFYNPIGDLPTKPHGSPVCNRPRYVNGTADAAGNKCPTDYEPIMNEAACQEAGICLGYCDGAEFREAQQNASQYNQYPLGCFIHKELGCFFFNPPQDGIAAPPSNPVGTPVCNVTKQTFYPWKAEYASAAPAPAAGGDAPAGDAPADAPAGDAPAGGDAPALADIAP